MKKNTYIALAIVAILAPLSAMAAQQTLSTLINKIILYLDVILVLLMAFAVVAFVYHVIKYFIMPDSDRKEAGMYVLYSVIGFFVILSFWGLVNILQNTFDLQNEDYRPSSWSSFKSILPGSSGRSGSDSSRFDDSNTIPSAGDDDSDSNVI